MNEHRLVLHDRTVVLARPKLFGVLNLTPDSFSDGGLYPTPESAVAAARAMILQGADVLDVGAESSRPGAEPVSAEAELDRLRRVLPAVLELGAPVSVDTHKPEVADEVLQWGAHLINDIGGLSDEMLAVAQRHHAPVIVMHMAGRPRDMQIDPHYEDVVDDVWHFLEHRVAAARRLGVQVIVDPGFGFGKTVDHNLELMRHLPRFQRLGVPVLIGTSRKSTLGALTGAPVGKRLPATLQTAAWALERGVQLLRVHDVAEHRQLIQTHSALAVHGGETTTIELEGIPLDLRLGVYEQERRSHQRVLVDLRLDVAIGASDDAIGSTVDYAPLPELVQRLGTEIEPRLLETLAERIAHTLLEDERIRGVEVSISKPFAAQALGCGAVVLRRRFHQAAPQPRSVAHVALGSNLGKRRRQLDAAVSELRRLGHVTAVSSWHETVPEGGVDHPRYLNGAARLETALTAHQLLVECRDIERRFGRPAQRSSEPEPRTLDLDLLFLGEQVHRERDLELPHPRMHTRPFVLEPLAEIEPGLVHPTLGRTVAELLEDVESAPERP